MSGAHDVALLILLPLCWILASIPAFVVGRRLGVLHPGEAFIPGFGPYIVVLHSIRRSGWLSLLTLIPIFALFFYIWLVCVLPGEHRRSRWWILPFLIPIVNFVAYYIYAFTLVPRPQHRSAAAADPGGGLAGLRQYQYVPIRSRDKSDVPSPGPREVQSGTSESASAAPAGPEDLFSPPSDV